MLPTMAVQLPLQFLLLLLAGWVNRHQEAVIEYLKEENRVLRELHGRSDFGSPTTSADAWR
mgnify:CR=1 FL=1